MYIYTYICICICICIYIYVYIYMLRAKVMFLGLQSWRISAYYAELSAINPTIMGSNQTFKSTQPLFGGGILQPKNHRWSTFMVDDQYLCGLSRVIKDHQRNQLNIGSPQSGQVPTCFDLQWKQWQTSGCWVLILVWLPFFCNSCFAMIFQRKKTYHATRSHK